MSFSKEELYSTGVQRTFDGTAGEAAFLLGGIGTGNVSIGARGEFRDWEIFNSPGKGNMLPYTFFAIWAQEEGKQPIAKVLESKLNPPFSKGQGFMAHEFAGLPRFQKSEMKGEYPLVWVSFKDSAMPVEVTLEAFTPLIPLNPDDSAIPGAFIKYRVRNCSGDKVNVSIAGSITNPLGFNNYIRDEGLKRDHFKESVNEYRTGEGFSGVYMYSKSFKENHLKYGNMSLITTAENVTAKPSWYDGGWWDGIQDMWDDFCLDGRLEFNSSTEARQTNDLVGKEYVTGSIGAYDTLNPGEEKDFQFILTWYFPNREDGWSQGCCGSGCDCRITQNYYSKLFKGSWDAAGYAVKNYHRLYQDTCRFHDALFKSSLPDYVIDAAASNIVALRSTTCFWLKNGKFFGWEGCYDKRGCCEGNCTHVWNYEQTLAFLFPSLERDMCITEFNVETEENGKMEFRTKKLFGESNNFHPAADGQLGCLIRLYREWKLSGDTDFLASVWHNAKKTLDFAFTYWDKDGDYVLDSQQHNTYDIEFYGPNSLVNSLFFGALKAGAEMALAMGDMESANKYKEVFEAGSARMDGLLWGGEYYIQAIEDVDNYKYQYGKGCLSDQLLGQLNSHVAGLGYILLEEHVKKAVSSIFKYNFLTDFTNHTNMQRTYTLNDEKGLILCSWPNGGRPKFPFVYSDEVWTGIEYHVAAHLIYEGFIDEGLTIVKAVRDRHDGVRRNPWNEVECGHHYVRAMASWGLIIALSGFKYDLVNGVIEFNPVINKEDYSCFFSCGKAWGVFRQKLKEDGSDYEYEVNVMYGSLDDVKVRANGKNIIT
jgi:non-lysosomal glucosylceramidase